MAAFLEYKNKVVNYFGDCLKFALDNGFEEHVEAMKAGKKRIEDNKLVIVTVGEVKRGKSTLLSAFLRDEGIFPVDVEVTTCLATAVCYGEKEKIAVTFADETTKEISRAEIREYATEKRNENNHKKVKWISVETPNPMLKDGVTIVDTPGVGSLNPEHTEVTYGFLPNADIVLFVSDATAELTNPELSFLRGVKRYCENFLFILTKKDLNADFSAIIDANIAKIEEFAGIPPNKVRYIPVSGTMKLASLLNGSERMAKSSNFEQLEAAIWNTIEDKRAEIIIAPPLGDLAGRLKEIDKEIHIKTTGLTGDAKEKEALKSKLRNLQEDRQRLLSDSNLWQMDIQREINIIGADQSKMMLNFKNRALDELALGLKKTEYLKKPELLLNEIVVMASATAHEISEEAFRRLCMLKSDFEDRTKLSLYDHIIKNELNVDDDPLIVFEKLKGLDKFIKGGRKVAINGAGGGAAGGILGGLVGGIVGLVAAGPAGVIVGIYYGAGIGASGGTLVGGAKGTLEALKPGEELAPKINAAISRYINQTYEGWRLEHPQYMSDISHKVIKSLRESIEQNKKSIEKDMEELQASSALNAEKRVAEQKKLAGIRAEFTKLVARLGELKPPLTGSRTQAREEATVTSETADHSHKGAVVRSEAADYSHLEE